MLVAKMIPSARLTIAITLLNVDVLDFFAHLGCRTGGWLMKECLSASSPSDSMICLQGRSSDALEAIVGLIWVIWILI